MAPGIYKSPARIGVTGTLTLNGSATDVWIFQAVSSLTTAAATDIVLTGGAQACNVFWQVGTSATLGTNTLFKGTIMADQSITDNGGSIVQGRLLASIGSVTLNNTTVVTPSCVLRPSIPRSTAPAAVTPVPPLINVTKIPTPLTLPMGGGNVTYDYAVTNAGIISMFNVTIIDNKCSNVSFVSGDTNNNQQLEVNEVWNYRCSKIVTKTETNTVTVRGVSTDNTFDAYDVASATVVIGLPLPPPLIHIAKKPNIFVLPAGGGEVTYSYSVTNPGTAPLNNVSIVDDKCTGLPGRVVGHQGDLNKNNLLESNETWQFTCQTKITKTTTNIATAQGHANGLTAIDFAQATVAVTSPGLPNTGYGPESNTLLNILVPTGILALLLAFYVARRKSTV